MAARNYSKLENIFHICAAAFSFGAFGMEIGIMIIMGQLGNTVVQQQTMITPVVQPQGAQIMVVTSTPQPQSIPTNPNEQEK